VCKEQDVKSHKPNTRRVVLDVWIGKPVAIRATPHKDLGVPPVEAMLRYAHVRFAHKAFRDHMMAHADSQAYSSDAKPTVSP